MSEITIQPTIESLAHKRLSYLNAGTFPFETRGRIEEFKDDLFRHGILACEDNETLTHSEKIPIEGVYFPLKDIILWSAAYFDVVHYYVINSKEGDGIIFVGEANHIEAAKQVFHVLNKMALEIREKTLEKSKRLKKESAKKSRINRAITQWLASVLNLGLCYSLPDNSDREEYVSYIQQYFKTSEDQRAVGRRALEIIAPFYDESKNYDSAQSLQEEIFNKFPRDYIRQTAEEMMVFQQKDMIMLFHSYKSNK